MENIQQARQTAKIIDEKQGLDIVILDISRQSSFADFFVNATATNLRMLDTMRSEIENQLAKEGLLPRNIEGKADSGWILMDYGDVIVNLFLLEQRNLYQIEKIWSDGEIVDLEEA